MLFDPGFPGGRDQAPPGIRPQAWAHAMNLELPAVKARLHDALICNCQVRFDETGRVCSHVPSNPPAMDS